MPNVHCVNNCTSTPGLAIAAGGSSTVTIGSTFFFKVNGRMMYKASGNAPSLALATTVTPITTANGAGGTPVITGNQLCYGGTAGTVAGNLAFDNGTVAATTGSCRIYTLCADSAQTEAGTVSLYWLAGADFPKHRQSQESDIAHTPLSTSVEVGYLYIKNESAAAFVPGTTALDTASVTTVYTNNYAQDGK